MRPTWTGYLKISLVAIPVRAFPATDSSDAVSFHQLHAASCQSRLQQKKWCPACDRAVPAGEVVKAYEFAPGRHVVVSDAELEAARPASTRVIDLVQFDDAGALDPMVVDRTYYLAPSTDPSAIDAYAVIRESLRGRVGVGKVAMYGREYLVAVRPLARVLVLHTLHHAGEIRPVAAIDELAGGAARPRGEAVKVARQLIGLFDAPVDLADFTDEYRAGVLRLIQAKVDGDEIVHAPAPAPAVGELAAALRQSLALMRKRRAAKVVTTARGRRRKGAAGRIELRPGSAV